MKSKLILSLALVLRAGLFGCSDEKTDERIESVKLPSGEILENHTYCESGSSERIINSGSSLEEMDDIIKKFVPPVKPVKPNQSDEPEKL
ncbi:MAG: hypothetical protein ACLQSR_02250 [Limisphaerales bacterium]